MTDRPILPVPAPIAPITQAWQQDVARGRFAWERRRRLLFFIILGSAIAVPILVLLALHLQSIPQPLGHRISHVHALPITGGVPSRASWRHSGWQSWQSTYQQAQSLLITGQSSTAPERYRSLVQQLDRLPLSRYPVPPRILYILQVHAYGHPVTAVAKRYVLDWYRERRLAAQSTQVLWLLSALSLLTTVLLTLQVLITNLNFQKTQYIYDRMDSEVKTQ